MSLDYGSKTEAPERNAPCRHREYMLTTAAPLTWCIFLNNVVFLIKLLQTNWHTEKHGSYTVAHHHMKYYLCGPVHVFLCTFGLWLFFVIWARCIFTCALTIFNPWEAPIILTLTRLHDYYSSLYVL